MLRLVCVWVVGLLQLLSIIDHYFRGAWNIQLNMSLNWKTKRLGILLPLWNIIIIMQLDKSKPPFSCFLLPKNGDRGSEPLPMLLLSCLDRLFLDWSLVPLSRVPGWETLISFSIFPEFWPLTISPLSFPDDKDEKLLFELRCLVLLLICPFVSASMIIMSE